MMYPLHYCLFALLFVSVSGRRIRRGSQFNERSERTLETEESFSFLYEDPTDEASESTLVGTSWTAVELNGALLSEENPITLSFDSHNLIYGHAGCNRYRGDIENLSEDSFRGPNYFSVTRMFCRQPGVMQREDEYLSVMSGKILSYIVTSIEHDSVMVDVLLLFDGARPVASFVQDTNPPTRNPTPNPAPNPTSNPTIPVANHPSRPVANDDFETLSAKDGYTFISVLANDIPAPGEELAVDTIVERASNGVCSIDLYSLHEVW
eukprot:CAMPEP_0183710572 /NCGR_PEP_ID=MMETSP0737-20130205/6278_1 /TAXON_ID=385413 /ORGANISM="Thalassiosira miniscula, Strain CCMP1093" /LENGTH=264 /DNA_ID=CAMNT_0025938877 /DNA_START=92 /DNA_END=883 /DNA_ORIENTATION=+